MKLNQPWDARCREKTLPKTEPLGFKSKPYPQGVPKSNPQPAIDPKSCQNWLLEARKWRVFKVWRRTGEKWSAEGLFKFPTPTNRSTTWSTVQFLHFLVSWSSPCHFQLKSLIFFYVQCQWNFDFWSKFDLFPKIISIWCIWYEFHAIIRYIQSRIHQAIIWS